MSHRRVLWSPLRGGFCCQASLERACTRSASKESCQRAAAFWGLLNQVQLKGSSRPWCPSLSLYYKSCSTSKADGCHRRPHKSAVAVEEKIDHSQEMVSESASRPGNDCRLTQVKFGICCSKFHPVQKGQLRICQHHTKSPASQSFGVLRRRFTCSSSRCGAGSLFCSIRVTSQASCRRDKQAQFPPAHRDSSADYLQGGVSDQVYLQGIEPVCSCRTANIFGSLTVALCLQAPGTLSCVQAVDGAARGTKSTLAADPATSWRAR